MKNASFVALFALALTLPPAPATAQVTAFLESCRSGTSVTGRFIYIGTYRYGNQRFGRTFESWCPSSVQVY